MQNTPIFSGLKVIELASVLAGPSVGQFFAELGSEVIKVENPETGGDVTRSWKLASEPAGDDLSAYFASVNMGKSSLLLNLSDPEDRSRLYTLIKTTDVVIVSYKPGDAEKLGVSFQQLKELKADIIYGHITGFGPDEERVGYDAIVQAEGGFVFLNGAEDGDPQKMPVALMDVLAAHHLKEGLLLALIRKMRTGEGSLVTVSLLDAAVSSLVNQATNWLVAAELPRRLGSEHPNIVPYGNIFKTADQQWLMIAVGTDRQFRDLCQILGLDGLRAEKKYADNISRVKNRAELRQILKKAFLHYELDFLCSAFLAKNIPFGRVQNMAQVFEMPQAKALMLPFEHGGKQVSGISQLAFRLSPEATAVQISAPPRLNDHQLEP